MVKNKTLKKLLVKYKEIVLLSHISGLLGWDTEVNLPPKASNGRAEQSSILTGLLVDRWHDPDFKSLLQKLNTEKNLNQEEKAILKDFNRSAKIYYKIPKKLLLKESELTSKAFVAWVQARKANDFKSFAPYLEDLVALNQQFAKYLGYKDNPYDALLDLYEPGLTAKFCKNLFATLTPELSQIVKNIQPTKKHKARIEFPLDQQKAFATFVLEKMGYDFTSGRMDVAPHPFETKLDHFDVRITNRYKLDSFVESLTGAMHEGGHALYEQGIDKIYINTPLDRGISLGIHESQSRFWENIVGRSKEFSQFITPLVKKYFPQLKNLTPKDFYQSMNIVQPGFIRVEADEVTYNLHIAIRFEIEYGLINNKIKVKDLPKIWNQKMHDYLGITPKNNSVGVLQDVHWAHGSFGYFPTYTLGNLYSAQFAHILKKKLDFTKLVKTGNFGPIREWLRKNIHQYGKLYDPDELSKKITKEILNPKYFLDYIKEKYA